MNLDYKLIGQRLAEIRKNANLTQENAAELIGATKGYINNIERGKKPSLEYLAAISQATNVSIDSILIGIQNLNYDHSTMEIVKLFSSVPENARPFVFGTIKTIIETGLNHAADCDTKNVSSASMSGAEKNKTKTSDIA